MNLAPVIAALLAIPVLGCVSRAAWAIGHCGAWAACAAEVLAIAVGLWVWLWGERGRL